MNLPEFFNITILDVTVKHLIIGLTKALFIYAFTQIAVWVAKYLFNRSERKQKNRFLDKTTLGFLRRIVVYAIYIVGLAVLISLIPGAEKIGNSILAGAGIMAMAIGFASQEALSNIISGLFIVFAKPFRVGDIIKIDEIVNGTVAEITLRHTVIRSMDNRMIMIPNSKINSSTIINSTIGEQDTCSFIEVGVSYDTDLDKAIAVMNEVIMQHPLLTDHRTDEEKMNNIPIVVIRVTSLGDSAITLKAWAWASNTGNAFAMKCDILKSLKERFDKERIEIPYPYNNVVVRK